MSPQNTSLSSLNSSLVVAPNEFFLRATINRNFEKLLHNDRILLDRLSEALSRGQSRNLITKYAVGNTYNKNDLVIFIDEKNPESTPVIYLLKCNEDNNNKVPDYDGTDVKDFSKSGWQNINAFNTLYNQVDLTGKEKEEHFSLQNYIRNCLSSEFFVSSSHINSIHDKSRYLLSDLTNISDNRENLFFPYERVSFTETGLTGYYEKYGNHLIEYTIFYNMMCNGYQSEKSNLISANTFVPDENNEHNSLYFLNETSRRIFCNNGILATDEYSNLNEYVNVYHMPLHFPIPFANTDYQIYSGANSSSIFREKNVSSINIPVYADKKTDSITSLLIVPNYNNIPIDKIALDAKSVFTCKIIGQYE